VYRVIRDLTVPCNMTALTEKTERKYLRIKKNN